MKKGLLIAAVTLLTVSMLAMGCPVPVEPVVEPPIVEVPKPGGVLTALAATSPDNLDPQATVMAISFWVFSLMVDTLVARDHNLEIVPHLAESWEISADGLTLTFHLRRDVRFHDGTPFNAEAAAFSFNRFVEVAPVGILAQLKETVAVDEYTIEMRLTAPAPMFLDDLTSAYAGIVSPAAVAKYGDDHGIKNMVGTGPFKFYEFIPGDRVELARNEEYTWGPGFLENRGPAYLERIELLVIPEAMTRVMEFEDRVRKGEAVTLMSPAVPTGDVPRLKADPAIQTISMPVTGADILFINTTLWPFDDVRVREAICHAINTKEIVEFVLDGLAAPAYTYISPTQIGYKWAAGPLPPIVRQFDPERARELFAEAGWLPGPDRILVHQETGRRAEFGLLAHTAHVGEPEVIKAQLGEIGLEISISILEPAASVAKAREGVYPLYMIGYGWPDITLGFDLFHTRQIGGLNFSFFSDPEVDELINTGLTSLDPGERAAAWNEAHVRILEKAPFAPQWHDMSFGMASTTVGGWVEYLGAHPQWSRMIFALDLYVVR